MSKCQHGQKIITFCATQCCVWRQAGGCSFCIKKYHNHMGPTVFVTQEQTNKLVKKYNVESSAKYKCRSLQQAVFNYFNTIKSQFDTFIDSACIDIMNQIGHPYLAESGMFPTYKRLKKKDYKKILQKDFRIFYEASQKINSKQLYEKQSNIYLKKVKEKHQFINQIEKIMRSLEAINKDLQKNYFPSHDGSMSLRINEIFKSIIKNSDKEDVGALKKQSKSFTQKKEYQKGFTIITHETSQQNESLSAKIKTDQSLVKQNTKEEDVQKKREEKQKIRPGRLNSLDKQFIKSNKLQAKEKQQKHDTSFNQSANKDKFAQQENIHQIDSKSPKKRYFDTKEVQINQKKQKLIDMMKNKEQNTGNSLKPYFNIKSTQKSENKISQKSASRLQGSGDSLQPRDQNYNFFAHTVLPRSESRKKIFEEAQQVAQKTVFIPVDVGQANQQIKLQNCQSPLMKNKFKSKEMPRKTQQFKHLNLQPISSPQQNKSKSKEQLMNELQLDEKKEKSLALLIKSLNLRVQQAIPYLQKSLQYASDNLSAAQYLSYLYLQIDRPKDCLTICNQMLEIIENSPNKLQISLHININKATALNMLGRYSESIVVLEQYLKQKPNQKIFKNLGDSYFSIGILEKANYYYEKAVSKMENYDEAHYNLAVCLFSQENYYNAKFSIMKALHVNPNNQDYKELKKQILLRIKQY